MIEVLHLFPGLNSALIDQLAALKPNQWGNSTLCKQWSVKDIAAHLLDTALRRVSAGRDDHFAATPKLTSYSDLLEFINGLNADWVHAYKRVSTNVLITQIIQAQDELYNYLTTLDLCAPALFPVSWAGEKESQEWFDIAREYTERWHHQQQIRLAVGGSNIILEREFYHPFLDICMQALPFHYKDKIAVEGTTVQITIVGEAGGVWTITRTGGFWQFASTLESVHSQVYIDQNIAWMLLSKGIDIFEAEQYWQVIGDYDLGFHALKITAFIV